MQVATVTPTDGRTVGGVEILPIGDTPTDRMAHPHLVPLTVLIVDDHRVVADAVASRLRVEDDIGDVVTVSNPDDALPTVARLRPDVVVWDVELGDRDGITLMADARRRYPRCQAVVVTAHDDARTAAAALRGGAASFVSKAAPTAQLVTAVLGAGHGESHVDPRLLFEVLPLLRRPVGPELVDSRLERLSPREREVLDHMVAGEDRSTIARELYVSVNTVRTHAKNILAKLEVHSTLEAVRLALESGLRPPGSGGSRGAGPAPHEAGGGTVHGSAEPDVHDARGPADDRVR